MIIRRLSARIELNAAAPPTEFRLFKAGVNETENGYAVLFDEEAAAAVLSAAKTWGVDMIVDLEHESLEKGPAVRPDQKDARASFRLEVRPGPELWAVGVQWTADGLRRLKERTQRYISPAFYSKPIEGQEGVERITEVINVALCAMPATRDALPLVASRQRVRLARIATAASLRLTTMDPEKVKAAIAALKEGNGDGALAVLEEVLIGLATAGPAAGAAAAPAETAVDPTAEAPDAPKPEETALLRRALAAAEKGREENAALRLRLAALEAKDAETEGAERAGLVAELVQLSVETPATAWEKDAKTGEPLAGKPCKRLASEPVAEMRERVKMLRASRPAVKDPKAPPSTGDAGSKDFQTSAGIVTLSASELQACEEAKAKPEEYALNKAHMLAARGGRSGK